MKRETSRQIFHLVVGILTVAFLCYFGRTFVAAATFFILITGTLLINLLFMGKRFGFVEWFLKKFERRDALFPGWGSACYTAGILIPLTFLSDISQVSAVIFVMAVGDSFSTIFGKYGKHLLPHNKNKSFEGSAAFLLSSLPAWIFVGPWILPLAFAGAVIESLGTGIDDNLTIPFVLTTFLLVVA